MTLNKWIIGLAAVHGVFAHYNLAANRSRLAAMKTFLAGLILLLGVGCTSASKKSYISATPDQLVAKMHRNDASRDYVWNHWKYAGSDPQFDYVYEYTPGSVIPYGFRFYKVPRGDLSVSQRYDFDPDYGNNARVF